MKRDEHPSLYLHGRGDTPAHAPGRAVLDALAPRPVIAPTLDEEWYGRPHATRVEDTNRWMTGVEIAVGHSFGAWLLLCAATVRLEHGRECPALVLLSTLQGRASAGGVQAIAPWSRRVATALAEGTPTSAALRARATFVHGDRDAQCPVESVRKLATRFDVRIVDSDHSLADPVGCAAIREAVREALCAPSSIGIGTQ